MLLKVHFTEPSLQHCSQVLLEQLTKEVQLLWLYGCYESLKYVANCIRKVATKYFGGDTCVYFIKEDGSTYYACANGTGKTAYKEAFKDDIRFYGLDHVCTVELDVPSNFTVKGNL